MLHTFIQYEQATRWMRYSARAIAIVWAGCWAFFGLASGIGEGMNPGGVFFHTALPGLIFLLTAAGAWRWEALCGSMLVLEGLIALVVFSFARTGAGLVWLTFPPLIAGFLFLVCALRTSGSIPKARPGG